MLRDFVTAILAAAILAAEEGAVRMVVVGGLAAWGEGDIYGGRKVKTEDVRMVGEKTDGIVGIWVGW